MKKLLMVLVAFMMIFTFVGCTEETTAVTTAGTTTEAMGSLRILQNKVEIGDVLTTYAEAWGVENNVDVEVVTCGGDGCAYGDNLLIEFQGTTQPDIFVIEGMGGYNDYEDYIAPLTGEAWLTDTDLEFMVDGVAYGFPVAVEGWGMAYNAEILEAAGVDPDTLTTIAGYQAAFTAIQAYYDANSMDDHILVSMAASAGMTWVTGLHNFNGYLSAGLDYDDSSVIDDLNAGIVNTARLSAYADWVELLFDNADATILTTGDYDAQVGKFAAGEAAFIHQGNWIDPNLTAYFDANPGSSFEMGYAPHAAAAGTNDSIFVSAPSYYCVNSESDNIATAKAFLQDLASTTAGHEYMVNEAKMIPAFKSVTLVPTNPLSAAVAEWMASGNIYAWWQNDMPSGFGMNTLGPIYSNYADGTIDKATFITMVTTAIEEIND
jgi:raffinose/stachyose/melibiose transport system substrate-binding protein